VSKPTAIIIDLDGTLCNTLHRQHFMIGDKKNWSAFYDALTEDQPNEWCSQIYHRFAEIMHVIFVSGRPDDYRVQTQSWLAAHGFGHTWLYMRKSGDYRKDATVKVEIYRELIEPNFDVLFCLDDRQQVVDAWREIGLTCLQCAKGDF
jgi:FMN phosphatase YigB (HAD superfamily)